MYMYINMCTVRHVVIIILYMNEKARQLHTPKAANDLISKAIYMYMYMHSNLSYFE